MTLATRRRLLAAGGLVATAGLAGVTGVRASALSVVAHRGFADEAPENTVEAVRYAVGRADAIEIDVRRCGSGELVCVHDETVERVTEATGRVSELDWETLRTLAVDGTSARIARLEEVLAATPPSTLLHVELKERGLTPDVLRAIEGREGSVVVSSSDPVALEQVRSLAPDLALAYTVDRWAGALETADELDCVAIHPATGLCFREPVIPAAHDRGLSVTAWTVTSRLEALALATLGVDGVFADRPLSMAEALRR